MKNEKFSYESPALEEAHFGQFVAGASTGETTDDPSGE